MNNHVLAHHGVLGMHWGVRRYQNKDGSLTSAGKKRAQKLDSEYQKLTGKRLKKSDATEKKTSSESESKPKSKSISEMTDQEIQAKINRITLENNLKSLTPKQVSSGQKFTKKVMNEVVTPAATDIGRQLAKSIFADSVNKAFKLEGENKVYANNKKK